MTTILVADSDMRFRKTAAAVLRAGGYKVWVAGRGIDSIRSHFPTGPDAIFLDPLEEPSRTVSELRAHTEAPIVVMSGRSDEAYIVASLDAGADGFLTKPFAPRELLAQLRATLRRAGSRHRPSRIVTRDFSVELDERRWFSRDGTEVHLTPTEWDIVGKLLRNPGCLIAGAELLRNVSGPEPAERSESLRVHMRAIRRKVEPDPSRPRYFITVVGTGIRFQSNAGSPLSEVDCLLAEEQTPPGS